MNDIIEVFPYIFLLMALFFFLIGGSVIFKNRAIVFSARWFYGFMVFSFLPSIIMSMGRFFDDRPTDILIMDLVSPVMYIVILFVFWKQMKGAIIIGVTDDSLRKSIHFTLKELNEDFEEALSKVILKHRDNELNVSIQSWMGSGQVKMKKSDNQFMKDYISLSNRYFMTSVTSVNRFTAYFYIIMGGLMVASSIGMFSHSN